MKERRKSYRERYFEDYEAIKVPANSRKGWRMEYRYIGRFCRWEAETGNLNAIKRRFAAMECVSVVIYIAALLSAAPFTHARLANGFGTLSLVPWILEVSGVIRFLLAGDYVRELSCEEIGRSIRSGAALRVLLVLLSAVSGFIQLMAAKTITAVDAPVLLAVLASAALSCWVKHSYDALLVLRYHNDNGQPGSRE